LLELCRREVQQCADLVGDVLHVPDVGAWSGQFDVAHAVTAHGRASDLDAAALARLASEALSTVLAAGALPVLLRSEDAFVEQAVALWLERAVVDGLRLGDLAVAPVADRLGAVDPDLDLREVQLCSSLTRPFTECVVHGSIAHQCLPDSSNMLTAFSFSSRTRTSRPSEWSSFTNTLN